MILTGPEIRRQIALGKERHGEKRRVEVDSPRRGGAAMDSLCFRDIVDDSMNYIHTDPYEEELVGPNSVDLRLGNKMLVYQKMVGVNSGGVDGCGESPIYRNDGGVRVLDMKRANSTIEINIPEEGIVLIPGILYLGCSVECIGSNNFVPIVEGRSSVGRLGIHVHVTAGFCDLGFKGSITLEIHVIHRVRIYPNVPICQAYFLKPEGAIELYKGRYRDQLGPVPSRGHLEKSAYADLPDPESP